MSSQAQDAPLSIEEAVRSLYRQLITSWNRREASQFASLFAPDGEVIGFDGSEMRGRDEIGATLRQIFADHVTAPYISKVKGVRLLNPEVALLRAFVGMVPPGQAALNPNVNAHQTLVAMFIEGQWRIQLFQNTPAQFHGRPELVQQMTQELQEVLAQQ